MLGSHRGRWLAVVATVALCAGAGAMPVATLTPYQCNPQGCENATVPAGAKAPTAMPAPLQCVQASTSPSDAGPACARQPRGNRMTLCMHWQTFKNVQIDVVVR